MAKIKLLETGERFGRWTVIKLDHIEKHKYKNNILNTEYYLVKCDCGNEKVVIKSCLVHGKSKSCGCLRKELLSKREREHGLSHTRIYRIWHNMVDRCYKKNDKDYYKYGARGIMVCNEWKENVLSFKDWALNNGYSTDLTLDRIDNNGNYEPNNCRWITTKEQNRNTRRNILITYNNETHCLMEWSEIMNMPYATIKFRLNKGWSIDDIFNKPILCPKKIKCVELDKIYHTVVEASKSLNIGKYGIYNCLKGKSKTCAGYHWQYIENKESEV